MSIIFPICSKHKCSMIKDSDHWKDNFYKCPMCESIGRNVRTEVRQFNIAGPDANMTDEEREEFWDKFKEAVELLNGSVL